MVGKGPEDNVFAFPVVAILEALLALGAILLLAFFSLIRNAPLEELANPDLTTNPAKAPWYFMALQELLLHGSSFGTVIFAYVEIDHLIYGEPILGKKQPIAILGFGRRGITAAAGIVEVVFLGCSHQFRE